MTDRIKDLLTEVADGIEPGDRLDAIRATTAAEGRTGRGWWAAGGAGLLAASVVTALALTTGGTPRSSGSDPAAPTPSKTATDRPPTSTGAPSSTVAVYYLGDSPDGPRLYREFRRLPGDPLQAAVAAAVGRDGDRGPLGPLDPDYRVPWPSLTSARATVDAGGDLIEISLGGDPQDDLHDRGDLSAAEAGLAVEQMVRTAQAAVSERLPVRFLILGEITDQVLGVPASEPLTAGSDLAVLSHVSLSDPSEGQEVDNDDPFTVKGAGNSFEGTIVITVRQTDDGDPVIEVPTIAGTYEDRLFPFSETINPFDLLPGDYVVEARTDDPSGEGRYHTDSRRITVVD